MKTFPLLCAFVAAFATASFGAGQYDADNTGNNVRDRGVETRTPTDQGGNAADRQLTATIRKAIVADDSLSTDAHNVKIITENGVVTLRGPVKTPAEKAAVVAKAEQAKGVKRIENQLEVEGK